MVPLCKQRFPLAVGTAVARKERGQEYFFVK